MGDSRQQTPSFTTTRLMDLLNESNDPSTSNLRPTDLPSKNVELFLRYDDMRNVHTNTFHPVVQKVIHNVNHYLKINLGISDNAEELTEFYGGSVMCPLEAAIAEVNQLLVGELAANMKALWRAEGKRVVYHSVASSDLGDIKTVADSPLNDSYLVYDCLETKKISLLELDLLNEQYREAKLDLSDTRTLIAGKVRPDEMLRYRRLKDVLQMIFLCYYTKDEDASPSNIAQFDFDGNMKWWDMLFHYKHSISFANKLTAPIDWKLRPPIKDNKDVFVISTSDLDSLPKVTDDKRGKWCGSETACLYAPNEWSADDRAFYRKLGENKICDFIKWSFFLKIACITSNHYEPLLGLHIPASLPAHATNSATKFLRSDLYLNMISRHRDFCDKLKASVKFRNFLLEMGDKVIDRLKQEIKKHNKRIMTEVKNPDEQKKLIVSVQGFVDRYHSYKNEVLEYHNKSSLQPRNRMYSV